MFIIPAGMMMGAKVSFADWWVWNQIPVTLGNIVGGLVFTGLALYVTYGREPAPPAVQPSRISAPGSSNRRDDGRRRVFDRTTGVPEGLHGRRRGAPRPSRPASAPAADPGDLQRQAQDRTIAAGGKLTPEEEAKRKKHPLDRFDEISHSPRRGNSPGAPTSS
jgi:hypothetical protein